VGKSYGEESWQAYQSNYEDVEHDAVAVMLQPVSPAEIANAYEPMSEEITGLPLSEGSAFDEFSGEEPSNKSLHRFIEQKRYEAALHSSSSVVDEPGFWREELRDSRNVKIFKNVMLNYLTYRSGSPTRVMSFSSDHSSAKFKPRVAANHLDFAADVCIAVRRSVKPRLNRVFTAFFSLSNGERADLIPAHVFAELAELSGAAFRKAGLYPVQTYFKPTMVTRKRAA
jgi:hypothetical protein